MKQSVRRFLGKWMWAVMFMLSVSLACDLGPQQPTATPSAPINEATTPPPNAPATNTPLPGGQGRVEPGRILLDQTTAISKGSSVNMTFTGVAEQVLTLDVNQISGKPRYDFHLVDKFGNFIANFSSNPDNATESLNEFTLPYEGTYKVVLTGTDSTGTIEVAITAGDKPSGGAKVDGPGKSLSALMSAPRVFHTYFISLTQGQVVTISAKANVAGTPDTSMVLYGPDGQYVNDADDVQAPDQLDAVIGGLTVPTTGAYVAIVTNKGSAIGSYTLSVSTDTNPPAAQGAASVVYDTDYPLGLFDGSNASVTFDATVGEVLKIGVSGLQETVGADLYLYSPFGQTIAYAVTTVKGTDAVINEVQIPYTGRYRLEIRPSGDGQGTLRVTHLPSGPTGGGVFGEGPTETLPGQINAPNVFHFYQFSANAGDRISVAVFSVTKSGKLDMGFALLGPNGKQLVFADDSDSDVPQDPELKDFVILQNGTYTVVVYSFTVATGTYDIELKRNQ